MAKIELKEGQGYYKIEATRVSPEVIFDYKEGVLSFRGFSLMPDSVDFYEKVLEIFQKGVERLESPKLKVIFHFIYLNTQSLKQIVSGLFNYIERLNVQVELYWYYSDEEMAELGTHLRELSDIPMHLEYKPQDKRYFDL